MDMKDKIQKLLHKAERTDNEAEATAFREAAERLMLKLGIEAAELEATGEVKPEEIIEVHRTWRNGYALAMQQLGSQVAHGLGNLRVLVSGSGNHRVVYVIGHRTDVAAWQMLATSVELQAMNELHRWQRAEENVRWMQTNWEKFKGSRQFLLSYGKVVGHRLAELRRDEQSDASAGAAIVLASKSDRVNAHVEETYGKLKQSVTRLTASSHGRKGGERAGMRADIGQDRLGGNKAIGS